MKKCYKNDRADILHGKMVIHQSHNVLNIPNHAKPLAGQPEGTQSTTVFPPIKERLSVEAKTK